VHIGHIDCHILLFILDNQEIFGNFSENFLKIWSKIRRNLQQFAKISENLTQTHRNDYLIPHFPNFLIFKTNKQTNKSQKQSIRMLFVVLVAFVVSWFPIQTFSLVTFLFPSVRMLEYRSIGYNIYYGGYFFFHWLSVSHSCLNPLIYCFMCASFKSDLNKLICRGRRRRTKSSSNKEATCTSIYGHTHNESTRTNTNCSVRTIGKLTPTSRTLVGAHPEKGEPKGQAEGGGGESERGESSCIDLSNLHYCTTVLGLHDSKSPTSAQLGHSAAGQPLVQEAASGSPPTLSMGTTCLLHCRAKCQPELQLQRKCPHLVALAGRQLAGRKSEGFLPASLEGGRNSEGNLLAALGSPAGNQLVRIAQQRCSESWHRKAKFGLVKQPQEQPQQKAAPNGQLARAGEPKTISSAGRARGQPRPLPGPELRASEHHCDTFGRSAVQVVIEEEEEEEEEETKTGSGRKQVAGAQLGSSRSSSSSSSSSSLSSALRSSFASSISISISAANQNDHDTNANVANL